MPSVLPTVVMHPDVMVERLRQQQVTIKEQSTRISELAAMIRQANQQRGGAPEARCRACPPVLHLFLYHARNRALGLGAAGLTTPRGHRCADDADECRGRR